MENIRIIASGIYLPKNKVNSREIEKKKNLEENYIKKRTGIEQRYYAKEEKVEELANEAVKNLFSKINTEPKDIDLIIVATTSTNNLMPGIANYIQKKQQIHNCICLDILAGCSGFINAFDIAKMYIQIGKINKAIVVGVDILSKYTNPDDIGTSIILSDGAGAVLIEKTENPKEYYSYINAEGENNEILTCKAEDKIYMDGIEVYKYAVTETVKNINKLLELSNEKLENIKYIIPHQSNLKIIKAIANRLKIDEEKVYSNIQTIGNTFCASIPIAICKMQEKGLLKNGDKVILLRIWRRIKYRIYFNGNIKRKDEKNEKSIFIPRSRSTSSRNGKRYL